MCISAAHSCSPFTTHGINNGSTMIDKALDRMFSNLAQTMLPTMPWLEQLLSLKRQCLTLHIQKELLFLWFFRCSLWTPNSNLQPWNIVQKYSFMVVLCKFRSVEIQKYRLLSDIYVFLSGFGLNNVGIDFSQIWQYNITERDLPGSSR